MSYDVVRMRQLAAAVVYRSCRHDCRPSGTLSPVPSSIGLPASAWRSGAIPDADALFCAYGVWRIKAGRPERVYAAAVIRYVVTPDAGPSGDIATESGVREYSSMTNAAVRPR